MRELMATMVMALAALLGLAGYLFWAPVTSSPPSTIIASSAGTSPAAPPMVEPAEPAKLATATFGSGCFWCSEALFQKLKGVTKVVSGYSGGTVKNPSYKEVCTGLTGHAEVIQVTYDPAIVSYKDLLEVFWKTHDPTTLNRQGNDEGTQYRSVIFYHDAEQKKLAEEYKARLDEAKVYSDPVVTEIAAFQTFYPAEDYHQNYYESNPGQGYCKAIIQPKLEKFKKVFHDKVK